MYRMWQSFGTDMGFSRPTLKSKPVMKVTVQTPDPKHSLTRGQESYETRTCSAPLPVREVVGGRLE